MSISAPQVLLTAQSLSATFQSPAVTILTTSGVAILASWTGSAVGTVIPQFSGDGVNFSDYDMTAGVLNNATDFCNFDIIVTAGPFVRLSYVSTSGTGTMNATVSQKGVN